eukprot:2388043-Rhodomonas_salina.1
MEFFKAFDKDNSGVLEADEVVMSAICLRVPYAMSGTDIGYGPTSPMSAHAYSKRCALNSVFKILGITPEERREVCAPQE